MPQHKNQFELKDIRRANKKLREGVNIQELWVEYGHDYAGFVNRLSELGVVVEVQLVTAESRIKRKMRALSYFSDPCKVEQRKQYMREYHVNRKKKNHVA